MTRGEWVENSGNPVVSFILKLQFLRTEAYMNLKMSAD